MTPGNVPIKCNKNQVCLKSKNLQIIDFAGFITLSLSHLTEAGGERGIACGDP
jgi:hypothetical protein